MRGVPAINRVLIAITAFLTMMWFERSEDSFQEAAA